MEYLKVAYPESLIELQDDEAHDPVGGNFGGAASKKTGALVDVKVKKAVARDRWICSQIPGLDNSSNKVVDIFDMARIAPSDTACTKEAPGPPTPGQIWAILDSKYEYDSW